MKLEAVYVPARSSLSRSSLPRSKHGQREDMEEIVNNHLETPLKQTVRRDTFGNACEKGYSGF